jgi:HK97 family phage prohead protease
MANDFQTMWREKYDSANFAKNTTLEKSVGFIGKAKKMDKRATKKNSGYLSRKCLMAEVQKRALEISSNLLEVASSFAKEITWITMNGTHIAIGADEPAGMVLSQEIVQYTINDISGQAQLKKMDALADKIRSIKLPDEVKSVKQLEHTIKSSLSEAELKDAKPFLANRFSHLYAMAEHSDEYPGMYEAPMKKSKEIQEFQFFLEKAFPVDKDGKRIEVEYKKYEKGAPDTVVDIDNMYIEGIASTTNVDHDGERMAPEAIDAMIEQVNKTGIPLMNEHQKGWDSKMGDIFQAWKDDRGQMYIKAKLDKDSSRAIDLYKAMKKGLQVGLSVAGFIKRSAQELVDGLGKRAKTFYDVVLKEISVTNRPSNFDTWLIAKSQSGSLEGHLFERPHPSYEEYLQNFPSLNWQLQIAKSVAEVSINMADENTEKKADETTEEAPKPEATDVAKAQQEQMAKAIEGISTLSKQIADLVEVVKAAQKQEETSETDDKKKKEEKPGEKPEEKKKAKKADGAEGEEEEEEVEDEEEEAEGEKKKKSVEVKKSTETEQADSFSKADLHAAAEILADKVARRLEAKGTRILGPLVDVIEKSMSQSRGRKSIGSEKAYLMEKNSVDSAKQKEDRTDELKKDLKNDKMDFKATFKKHFSSFGSEEEAE